MDLHEKLEAAARLESLGVDCLEAGFAISSPGDFESVRTIARQLKSCSVASLARATVKDIDVAWEAVREAASPRLHVFLATSPVHMQYKLRMTPEAVLEAVEQMVRHARRLCPDVEFSAEDATRSERGFLCEVFRAAIRAGATTINVPDTVGYATPEEMHSLISHIMAKVPEAAEATVSVHCHDDLGMAVANSLAGVAAGASQVECTVNGIGERAGNAAMEEVAMALQTRRDYYGAATRLDSTQIYRTSRLIYDIIGQVPPLNKAIVGANAFLHESGIHQHGVMAKRSTYEIMTPESVGIQQKNMVLGKHSGRHAFEERLSELGYSLTREEMEAHFATFKSLCDRKKILTDSDLEAIVSNRTHAVEGAYKLVDFDVHSSSATSAVSVLRLEHEGEVCEDASLGDGPVDAAYRAIDKMTGAPAVELESYQINATSDGADALGEAIVKLRVGDKLLTGRGLSTDVIESSILAYLNAINKVLAARPLIDGRAREGA
jgi:2-isopropylmalate synthase